MKNPSNRIFGYCRISTPQQSIDRQIRNIKKEFPNAYIVKEAYTGTKMDRPKWARLYNILQPGDTVVFDSVSRLSRNAEDGMQTYEDLFLKKINLIFLKEPQINTSTYKRALENSVPMTGSDVDLILEGVNKFLIKLAKTQVKISFEQAEKEVADLHQRTREGLLTARLKGKQLGQPEGVKLRTKKGIATMEIIKMHSKDFGGTLSDSECQILAGVSRNTFYKYKRELQTEAALKSYGRHS
ncbi:MAG: recombinase family protein [Candidatus Limivicinus sp.]